MRVKGTMLLDYLKVIRANKDKNWNQYLKPEDWEIINDNILASTWYPLDSYRRMGYAVFKEIAKGDLNIARGFGRFNCKNLLQVYKNVLVPGDPMESAKRLARLRRNFFDQTGDSKIIELDKTSFKNEVYLPAEDSKALYKEAFVNHLAGLVEEIVEQAGGKNVKSTIEDKAEGVTITVKWE